jgi:hypothetical protein
VKIYDVTGISSAIISADGHRTPSCFLHLSKDTRGALAQKAIIGYPTERIFYAAFTKFAILHQQRRRFVTNLKMEAASHTKQMFREVLGFSLGNLSLQMVVVLIACGVPEAGRAIDIMTNLPSCWLSNVRPRCQIAVSYPLLGLSRLRTKPTRTDTPSLTTTSSGSF